MLGCWTLDMLQEVLKLWHQCTVCVFCVNTGFHSDKNIFLGITKNIYNMLVWKQKLPFLTQWHHDCAGDLWCWFLTPAPERGCVIIAARGWRLWGTQRRRCLLSSWPRSSSCWALLSVGGDGNETPCTNQSHFRHSTVNRKWDICQLK